jgi:hypothetical protein
VKLSALINQLQDLYSTHGDIEVETRDGDAGLGYGGPDLAIRLIEGRVLIYQDDAAGDA